MAEAATAEGLFQSPVVRQWASMWPVGAIPKRPWWTRVYGSAGHGEWTVRVQRCDGLSVQSGPGEIDRMAAADREKPLPRPPTMVGQVWFGPWGCELVTTTAGVREWLERRHPLPYLLAGPTPWGRDVPWVDLSNPRVVEAWFGASP